jgi:hypothetical protein
MKYEVSMVRRGQEVNYFLQRSWSDGYDYDLHTMTVEANDFVEAENLALVENPGYTVVHSEIWMSEAEKVEAEKRVEEYHEVRRKEREERINQQKEKEQAKKIAKETEKAIKKGMTLEEYQADKKKKAKIARYKREVRQMEEQIAELEKQIAYKKNWLAENA